MVFKIGDRVRLEVDHPESVWVVVSIDGEANKVGIVYSVGGAVMMQTVAPSQISLVEPNSDLKQAIREVLLSEEFLAAFAKAFINAPMPSTIQPAVTSTQVERSIAQEAFEWFKSEDVFLNGESN